MGFKEIDKFNDALLAKQVWIMINNPESLCYRVFKARFFLDCSILDAKESTIGSYAWKSILSVRDVIQKGMVWQIGNGQLIQLREDIDGSQYNVKQFLYRSCLQSKPKLRLALSLILILVSGNRNW